MSCLLTPKKGNFHLFCQKTSCVPFPFRFILCFLHHLSIRSCISLDSIARPSPRLLTRPTHCQLAIATAAYHSIAIDIERHAGSLQCIEWLSRLFSSIFMHLSSPFLPIPDTNLEPFQSRILQKPCISSHQHTFPEYIDLETRPCYLQSYCILSQFYPAAEACLG